jgi:membrane-associated phospholipid phosphatase
MLPKKRVVHPENEKVIPSSIKPPPRKTGRQRIVTWLAGFTVGLILFLIFLPSSIRETFWNRLQSQAAFVSMLLVFSLVAISLIWSAGQKLDSWIFILLNVRGSRPKWLDWIMLSFTQLGNALAALGIALILFFSGSRTLSYELMLGSLSLWLVVELIKLLVHRSRPFIRLEQVRIVGYRPRGRSFPSGHTSQVFFMTTLIAQHFHLSGWIWIVLYAVAILVGITRMYVGAHYPRDVLAGAILGSAWGLLGLIFDGYVL